MDSIHDLGGMHGFGEVEPEVDEPPFHQPWEGRVHGLALSCAAVLPGKSLRPYIERMGNEAYLTTSYYEHWLAALEARLLGDGILTADELADRQEALAQGLDGEPGTGRQDPDAVAFLRSLLRPFEVTDPEEPAARFAPGQAVRVKRLHPRGHTRCPRYVRGVSGTIALVHPPQRLPDEDIDGGNRVEPFYSVAFAPTDLWGADAEAGAATVHVDLWESYLDEVRP